MMLLKFMYFCEKMFEERNVWPPIGVSLTWVLFCKRNQTTTTLEVNRIGELYHEELVLQAGSQF